MEKHLQDRQNKLLEIEDPRFYAIDKSFGDGTMSVATIEKLGNRTISFGIPSSPGLFLSLALRARNEVIHFDLMSDCFDDHGEQGIYPDDQTLLFDFFELMITQIVFSHAAVEAFANIKIPNDFIFKVERKDKRCSETYNKEQIERNLNLDIKLDKILAEVYNVKSPMPTKLWDQFTTLKKLRDRLMHLKSADMSASDKENKSLWGDLMRHHHTNFPEIAHNLIGHYISKEVGHTWFKKYPYYKA